MILLSGAAAAPPRLDRRAVPTMQSHASHVADVPRDPDGFANIGARARARRSYCAKMA